MLVENVTLYFEETAGGATLSIPLGQHGLFAPLDPVAVAQGRVKSSFGQSWLHSDAEASAHDPSLPALEAATIKAGALYVL